MNTPKKVGTLFEPGHFICEPDQLLFSLLFNFSKHDYVLCID